MLPKGKLANELGIFKDILGLPALSVYVWQDGAYFDTTMNYYMNAPFPAGIDPSNPRILQSNLSYLGNSTMAGILLTGNATTCCSS